MTKPLFPRSVRKHIRFQKALIRRGVLDSKKQQELIQELYLRFAVKPEKKEEKPRKVTPKKKEELVAGTKDNESRTKCPGTGTIRMGI